MFTDISSFLNESFNKDKSVVIEVNNPNDMKKLMKDLKEWGFHYNKYYSPDEELEDELYYPMIISFDAPKLTDEFFIHVPDAYDEVTPEDFNAYNLYSSIDDFYNDKVALEHIKTMGGKYNIPNYNPRRVDRTVESLLMPKFPQRFLSDAPWDVVIFRFNTKEGLERTKKYIEQFGIFIYFAQLTGVYPADLYLVLKSTMSLRKNNLYEVTQNYYDSGDFQKNFSQTVICPILLHMDHDTEEADNFFNTHIFRAFPDYKPRHIDRSLNLDESYFSGGKPKVITPLYDVVIFKVKNLRDARKIQSNFFNEGFSWITGSQGVLNLSQGAPPFYFYLDRNEMWFFYEQARHIQEDVYSNIKRKTDGERYRNATINPTIFNIDDTPNLYKLFNMKPSYTPRKMERTLESLNSKKILMAFDLDDTLVYSTRFEEYVKPLLVKEEFLTPEIILNNKVDDLGIKINDLKYEHGRIYFDDPKRMINISSNSSWVRKGDRVYITQPDAYFLTEESMPIGVYQKIVDIYNKAENKAIITSRRERLRNQTKTALSNLGIEKPNYGLFMYPSDSLVFQAKWKALKLQELFNEGFSEIHFFDDNMKVLKRIKSYLKKLNVNISLYKVNENNYRKI